MSPLHIFLPGWKTPPPPISEELQNEAVPINDSPDWSTAAANDVSEPRYADYCDKKYDGTTTVATSTPSSGWSTV